MFRTYTRVDKKIDVTSQSDFRKDQKPKTGRPRECETRVHVDGARRYSDFRIIPLT